MLSFAFFFFFNDTATTEIYTLSLHDALPIFLIEHYAGAFPVWLAPVQAIVLPISDRHLAYAARSEEHTSELQSLRHLVCRLLLEKKKILGRKRLYLSIQRRQESLPVESA